jgi:dihydrofolate reductase
MGRKTWESLPPKFRPLPGRSNIVVTRQAHWQAEGALRAASLPEALALCNGAPLAWVTGGADLFREALPFADTAEVTLIDADFEGDSHAPELGPEWQEVAREPRVSSAGLPVQFHHVSQDTNRGLTCQEQGFTSTVRTTTSWSMRSSTPRPALTARRATTAWPAAA